MNLKRNLLLILVLIISFTGIKGQSSYQDRILKNFPDDSSETQYRKSDIKISGGIFVAPSLGVEFPLHNFNANSKSSLCLGIKLEYASRSVYPLIFGVSYEHQDHNGKDNYKTMYYLNSLETKISSYGAGIDIILNKYLKSNYTIPFLIGELKYITVQRLIDPAANSTNLTLNDNLVGFMGGLGLTLYIFDIYFTYTFAREFTSFAIKTRFHFPVIKF